MFDLDSQRTQNHFKFLKVGPELTFHFSRAVFEMEKIENMICKKNLSNIKNIFLSVMKNYDEYWIDYYKGSHKYLNILKFSSYLDRLRYYWDFKKINKTKEKLFFNINGINEFKFFNSTKFLKGKDLKMKKKLKLNNAEFIIFKSIERILRKYYLACGFKLKKNN